jgi:dUTP pyrophosphatase
MFCWPKNTAVWGSSEECFRINAKWLTSDVFRPKARQKSRFDYFCLKNHILTIKIINQSPYPLPHYETPGSAGMDLRAHLESPLTLGPLERTLVPTGLFIELPTGYEAQVRPRSGLAAKRGLTMLNSPGTIDSDYRGEIKCIVVNLSNEAQTIEPGERIAQMVIARHERAEWQPVAQLSDSERGAGGFGSTGKA